MSTIYDWIKAGHTLVPNVIFTEYKELDLSSDEMVYIIFIMSQMSQNKTVDDPSKVSEQLGWSMNKVFDVLDSLITKNYISIDLVPDEQGKQTDHYSLRPFFDQLDEIAFYKGSIKDSQQEITHSTNKTNFDSTSSTMTIKDKAESSIVSIFEQEFGRMLSPLELETLNQWIQTDGYDIDLIKLALKEAVIHQAYSLKYIDKILLSWQQQNIQTVGEAQHQIKNYKTKNNTNSQIASSDYEDIQIPMYDWDQLNR